MLCVCIAYTCVGSKWHDWNPHPALTAMPPLRRSLLQKLLHQMNDLLFTYFNSASISTM